MSSSKKGFTLIEVLVVMLVSTLVLTMVGGAMVFITTSTNDLIEQSEEIDMAKNIEKYLRSLANQGENILEIIRWNEDEKAIENNGQIVFTDERIAQFEIVENDVFIKCYLEYESGRNFTFIISSLI